MINSVTKKAEGIDKELVLRCTNNGLDIYRRFDPHFKELRKNHQNPVLGRKQETPSFNIYLYQGKYLFKDFATEHQGDVFTFAGLIYGIDPKRDFPFLLDRIAEDFNIY